jgi:hypothetical protein
MFPTATCKYSYSTKHAGARYMAEMIALAPIKISNLFDLVTMGGPDIPGANHASFHWYSKGATTCVTNEAAIVQVKEALADACAAYAANRTATHVPKWTFMYNRACKEDLKTVAAIRGSPPPVAIQFAINTNLPPGETCVLFPGGGFWEEARERLAAELKNCTDRCFPQRPAFAARFTVVLDARAVEVRKIVTQLHQLAEDIYDFTLTNSETVTTLWVKEDDKYKVYYGDGAVLSQLSKCTTTFPATPPYPPSYVYHYRPDHDQARYLAEIIALAPSSVASLFTVHANAGLDVYASYTMHTDRPVINDAALVAVKKALMDGVARATQYAEYTFCYDPACQSDMEAIENLRSYPPNVAMNVVCVKQELGDEFTNTNCSFRWGKKGTLHQGAAARAKMSEILSWIHSSRFRPFVQRRGFACVIVMHNITAHTQKIELESVLAACRSLPENTVYVQFHDDYNVVTTLWTDNGKRVWYGNAAVLLKLQDMALQLVKPVLKTVPLSTGFQGVRFQMFVREKERAMFFRQLDTVPASWRSRIAVVFVEDEVQLEETCVDMWPQVAGSPPKPTCYQDVLAMLV